MREQTAVKQEVFRKREHKMGATRTRKNSEVMTVFGEARCLVFRAGRDYTEHEIKIFGSCGMA